MNKGIPHGGPAAAQAEVAIHESEARYRTLFETLIEGFCTIEMIFDATGKPVDYRFLEINPAFEKQTGLRNAQGKLMRDLAPDHEAHWFEIYGKVALTGEPVHFENEAKALGRHYDVCAYRVGGPESRKVAILFNDITERKIADEKIHALYGALQTAYEDLRHTREAVMQQERLRALGQMASGIAHDINNAISPVALYTDFLLEQEPNLSAQGRGFLQTIQRAIHDVAATVARMREFYRQRELQLVLTPVHLNPLVQQVVDLTRARWSDMPQQRGIVIQLEPKLADDLPLVMGVESEIREALTNLIFNAVDAMPQGGTLMLRTKAIGESSGRSRQVQLEVSDTGIGMDEEARRRCLEPFFTTKGERGTGLGLAMVYGMVRRHSADIEIESALGRGTTIRLIFSAPADAAPALVSSPAAYAVPKDLRILIVDDDPVLLQSLRDTLQGDGHAIVTASGGQQGIDLFREARENKQTFDVVVTDLGMPYVDGRQVASVVKVASPTTPVILLTGWGQRLLAEGDVPPQVDCVLNKPPKLRELREALARCCGAQ